MIQFYVSLKNTFIRSSKTLVPSKISPVFLGWDINLSTNLSTKQIMTL
jgi:hypothetical protein